MNFIHEMSLILDLLTSFGSDSERSMSSNTKSSMILGMRFLILRQQFPFLYILQTLQRSKRPISNIDQTGTDKIGIYFEIHQQKSMLCKSLKMID